jgi:hypothetical protein
LGRGERSAPAGALAEFSQALGDPLALFGLTGFIPDQDKPENLPMLRLRGSSVLSRPYAQTAHDIVIQVANRDRRHRQNLCFQALQ